EVDASNISAIRKFEFRETLNVHRKRFADADKAAKAAQIKEVIYLLLSTFSHFIILTIFYVLLKAIDIVSAYFTEHPSDSIIIERLNVGSNAKVFSNVSSF